jgi:hypothetical protein
VKELQTQWDAWNATLMKPLWGQGSAVTDSGADEAPAKKRRQKKQAE